MVLVRISVILRALYNSNMLERLWAKAAWAMFTFPVVGQGLGQLGGLAGQQAEKILVEGKTPEDIPVLRMTRFAYVVNMEVAKKLNLFPPIAVLEFAETVK